MRKDIVVGGLYRHFKGPDKVYRVLRIAYDCDNPKKEIVVYEQLYESKDFPRGTVWVRPLEEFLGEKWVEGGLVKRFELVKE
jgi:hypothetical protein